MLIIAAVARPALAREQSPIISPEMGTNSSPKDIEAAKLQGAATATKDIKAGEFRILYFGLPWSTGKPLVDEATGYRVQIVAGCMVTSQFSAEVYAYNETMRDWHAKTKPLSSEEIDRVFESVNQGKKVDRDTLHRALISDQKSLRADAARLLGEVGDATSVPHLIDALSDQSHHVGADYSNPGMATTRYWANASLKKLTKQDFGFVWDAPEVERQAAIKRWQVWYHPIWDGSEEWGYGAIKRWQWNQPTTN